MQPYRDDLDAEPAKRPINPYGALGCALLMVTPAMLCLAVYALAAWVARGAL